jgi:PEP-CTERM motif
MSTAFGIDIACFVAQSDPARSAILRSSTAPEPAILFLLGGGLMLLAGLVRRFYRIDGVAAPKSLQVILWISPKEIADHLSAEDGD